MAGRQKLQDSTSKLQRNSKIQGPRAANNYGLRIGREEAAVRSGGGTVQQPCANRCRCGVLPDGHRRPPSPRLRRTNPRAGTVDRQIWAAPGGTEFSVSQCSVGGFGDMRLVLVRNRTRAWLRRSRGKAVLPHTHSKRLARGSAGWGARLPMGEVGFAGFWGNLRMCAALCSKRHGGGGGWMWITVCGMKTRIGRTLALTMNLKTKSDGKIALTLTLSRSRERGQLRTHLAIWPSKCSPPRAGERILWGRQQWTDAFGTIWNRLESFGIIWAIRRYSGVKKIPGGGGRGRNAKMEDGGWRMALKRMSTKETWLHPSRMGDCGWKRTVRPIFQVIISD